MRTIVEPASKPRADYREWSPSYPAVVSALTEAMQPLPHFLTIEHVGSTAVRGCGGKGIIDLLALYRDGLLAASCEFLRGVGFGPQGSEFRRPWPESRPMYLGEYQWDDRRFTIYVHVLDESSDEVRRFRVFRDRLLNDSKLIRDYSEAKRRIIEQGVVDTDDYAVRKRSVIHDILGSDYELRKAAQPGATDNPDDAQRLREDH